MTAPEVPRIELAPGYSISRVIHGGWQLSAGHRPGTIDAGAELDRLTRLAGAGFTTFDCADIYTGVEELFGRFVASRPAGSVQVHTKFVPDLDVLPSISRDYVEGIIDRSLRRLRVERLDLVQYYWWDGSIPGYVETAGWLDELRREGKIRHLGVTNFDVPAVREILDAGVSLVSNQVQYSLLDRRPERGMTELCAERGMHLLCYGSLAGGFLRERWVGAVDPEEPLANRSLVKYRLILDELGGWTVFQELLSILREIARKHGVSIASVASRFTLERPRVGAAIVGLGRQDYLDSTLEIFGFELDGEDHERLDAFLGRHPGPPGDVYSVERVPGGRHAVIMKTGLNRGIGRSNVR